MKKYFSILALVAITGNAPAAQLCLTPPPQAPTPINGINASAEDILSYRTAVLEYLENAENRLACLEETLQYNRQVYKMTMVSKTFNTELNKYYSRVASR